MAGGVTGDGQGYLSMRRLRMRAEMRVFNSVSAAIRKQE
jgi:hypothetical protein